MSVFFLNFPPSEEAKKIFDVAATDGTEALHFKLKYVVNEEFGRAEYRGVYTENDVLDEDDDYLVVDVLSRFCSYRVYDTGTDFVNLMGTTGDHPEDRGAKSWLGFYEYFRMKIANTNARYIADRCFTDGFSYYVGYGPVKRCAAPASISRDYLVGGHVLIGQGFSRALNPEEYGGREVAIIPICKSHNAFNDGYMRLHNAEPVPFIDYIITKKSYEDAMKKAQRL
ncbi:MAG: hypothetical protein IK016_01785 [Lachnospiraceae bacterium]|nr:hypothetical protein [Lachnospiraceae bacterium]